MSKPKIAALAAALALGSTSLWAMSGDEWYGTNRASSIEVTRAQTPTVAYEEIVSGPVYVVESEPRYVTREYVVMDAPRDVVVVTYGESRAYDPLFPERGPWINHGLFNEKGPNDFGQ